jgi:hypothetical protein
MIKQLALILSLTTSVALADNYTGNGQSGFGGPVGLGSLNLTDDLTTITGTLTNGNTGSGMNDGFVIYIDTVAGGASDTSGYTDTGGGADFLRKAISGFDSVNRSTLTFPTGFAPDFAIALAPNGNANFGGLWSLSDPTNFGFVDNVNLTPNNDPNATSYTFSFNFSELGLTSGGTFNFVTTYLNSNGAFRSNEAIGNHFTNEGAGNFGATAATATGINTYTGAAIPEPSTLTLLAGPALLGGWFFVRRRRVS